MANRITGKVIVIDTTDTQIVGPLAINMITWVSTDGSQIAATNGLNIKLKNADGPIILACQAQAGEITQPYAVHFSDIWRVSDGLYVEDIDGGELQIVLA